jgi:hypothetical protein
VSCRERGSSGGKVSGIGSELGGFQRGGGGVCGNRRGGAKHEGGATLGGARAGKNHFSDPPSTDKGR